MLKAAIYGMGRWGNRLMESVQASGKIRFVKGVSRDPDRHADVTKKTGMPVVASYASVLQDAGIDAVVLATPHTQHEQQIIDAARARKHVFVEKPLALTRASAERAIEACRTAGVTLGLGFNRRHTPAYREMVRRIRAGDIGEVLHVEGQHSGPSGYRLKAGNWRASRDETPGGGMTPRGIHTLDAMIHIAGPVSSVYAYSERRALPKDIAVDDTTSMLLKFSGGATGYLATVVVTGELWRVHVFGTKGWLEMRGDTDLLACGLEGTPERIPLDGWDREQATLEAFADAVAAKQPFMVPPDEAVNGIAVIEAVVASSASGAPVKIG